MAQGQDISRGLYIVRVDTDSRQATRTMLRFQ